MHKATFLEGTLRFTITPDGPILIKAGESSGVDPTLPDMRFVRSQSSIYIPGPSLKGVVRAQAERICRSLDGGELQAQKRQARQQHCGDERLERFFVQVAVQHRSEQRPGENPGHLDRDQRPVHPHFERKVGQHADRERNHQRDQARAYYEEHREQQHARHERGHEEAAADAHRRADE